MKHTINFLHNNETVSIDFEKTDFRPSTTVLNYLRRHPQFRGTKEGCAEGDCGACTIVVAEAVGNKLKYKAVDSCLLFLPALHGKQLITVENLATDAQLHPVQQAMVDYYGSQCGYCTPGFVMALFALYKSEKPTDRKSLQDSLVGNLCRCTGYEPILQAAAFCCNNRKPDHFSKKEAETINKLNKINDAAPDAIIETNRQSYYLPSSIEKALQLRKNHPDASIVNGATDTAIVQNKTWQFLPKIIDLSNISELKTIKSDNKCTYFGSGVSIEKFREFAKKQLAPVLPMLDVFASIQIREVASIGGNLSTASPIGDLIPLMIALKARLEIAGPNGKRWVEMEDFITAYRTNCMHKDELLLGIEINHIPENVIFSTAKVSTRRDLDISTLNIAMRLQLDDQKVVKDLVLAYGGMAATVKRAIETEKQLLGKVWNLENIKAATLFIPKDFTPISDARSGADYRMEAAKNLLVKMFVDQAC